MLGFRVDEIKSGLVVSPDSSLMWIGLLVAVFILSLGFEISSAGTTATSADFSNGWSALSFSSVGEGAGELPALGHLEICSGDS